jgi:hypothetical protein
VRVRLRRFDFALDVVGHTKQVYYQPIVALGLTARLRLQRGNTTLPLNPTGEYFDYQKLRFAHGVECSFLHSGQRE